MGRMESCDGCAAARGAGGTGRAVRATAVKELWRGSMRVRERQWRSCPEIKKFGIQNDPKYTKQRHESTCEDLGGGQHHHPEMCVHVCWKCGNRCTLCTLLDDPLPDPCDICALACVSPQPCLGRLELEAMGLLLRDPVPVGKLLGPRAPGAGLS